MMICFDWLFPESARSLALKGAQLIAHPANLVLPYCPDALVTRCLENHVFTATADRVGSEQRGGVSLSFIGSSEIVDQNGNVLLRLSQTEEQIASADIDLSQASNKRINERNDVLADRRPDQYTA
jgi:predicted amidohydrolase